MVYLKSKSAFKHTQWEREENTCDISIQGDCSAYYYEKHILSKEIVVM